MNQNNKDSKDFKAVEYMRGIREELNELYHSDKKKYLAQLKKSFDDFKKRQKEIDN